MEVVINIGDKKYVGNLNKPLDISIKLENENSPIAFHAPPYNGAPVVSGDFIGSLEKGSPVNFYNLSINPHGNGTHTESVLHIDKRGESISDTLVNFHFVAKVITVKAETLENGDTVINAQSLGIRPNDFEDIDALIIRTLPNFSVKKNIDYSGVNPTYFTVDAIELINQTGIKHLLVDVPSVDREQDGGKLISHKTFWNINTDIKLNKTITEMIFVDNNIKDGLYLLNLQIISVDIDASPSKPILYELKIL